MQEVPNISNLAELLQDLEAQSTPVFVSLCTRCRGDNQLLDAVLQRIQKNHEQQIGFKKLSGDTAQRIKDELHTAKNPVVLLISKGEINAIFGGITAQYRFEEALKKIGRRAA